MLEEIRQAFWVDQEKREKKAMQGYWGVVNLLTRFCDNAGETFELRIRNKISLDDLIQRVIADTSLEMAQVRSTKRDAKTSEIRSIISFLAVNQLGMSAKSVADKLGITGMAVGKCANRAQKNAPVPLNA
ncbi:MAG: hypothetical protein U5R49_07200 [Deltaproteobacteria bacterium]|nr:hypothetical protein [Deltaproteobacteria bacterium]